MKLPRFNPNSRLFIGIAIVVTVAWVLVIVVEKRSAPGVTMAMSAVITGAVSLAAKKEAAK